MGTHQAAATREEIDPKATARQQAVKRQQKLAPEWVNKASHAIQQHLVQLPEFKSARCVACYLALPREVQTREIIHAGWSGAKRMAVPAFQKESARYGLAWLDREDATHEGAYGITEPIHPRWVKPGEIELILVPCVAFDEYGRRLGHGGGHFDRLLGRHGGLKICLAFEGQRLAAVPVDPHDVPVDIIITEKKIYDTRRGGG